MVRFVVGLVTGLLVLLGGLATPVSAQEGVDLRTVMIRDTNLYAEASWDAEVIALIPAGTVLVYQHNVSETGFMIMSYDGYDGWVPLDSFVPYADYYGTDERTEQPTTDVEALPDTGAGPSARTSTTLPLLGVALLGLLGTGWLLAKLR